MHAAYAVKKDFTGCRRFVWLRTFCHLKLHLYDLWSIKVFYVSSTICGGWKDELEKKLYCNV